MNRLAPATGSLALLALLTACDSNRTQREETVEYMAFETPEGTSRVIMVNPQFGSGGEMEIEVELVDDAAAGSANANAPRIERRDVPPRASFALESAGVHPLLARLFAARGVRGLSGCWDRCALAAWGAWPFRRRQRSHCRRCRTRRAVRLPWRGPPVRRRRSLLRWGGSEAAAGKQSRTHKRARPPGRIRGRMTHDTSRPVLAGGWQVVTPRSALSSAQHMHWARLSLPPAAELLRVAPMLNLGAFG